jgi:inner membrane transporter RhtA
MPKGSAYFAGSAVFHYLGPSFAVLLFAQIEPAGVAWLRIATAASVYAVWRRPWRRPSRDAVAMGLVLGAMNPVFYLAIDRLPLATVAAIEFLPVVALAALGARTARNITALAVAFAGVWLLTDVQLGGNALGFVLAFANAGLFALYIVFAHRVSRDDGIDGLASAMLVALAVVTPLGLSAALPAFGSVTLLAAGLGVGVTSSVLPYVCDQLAMARMPRATYALCVSLLPATAAVIGVVVLRQVPTVVEAAGIALVVCGVALHKQMSSGRTGTRASSRPVAARRAETIAAVETTVGGSPTPLTP